MATRRLLICCVLLAATISSHHSGVAAATDDHNLIRAAASSISESESSEGYTESQELEDEQPRRLGTLLDFLQPKTSTDFPSKSSVSKEATEPETAAEPDLETLSSDIALNDFLDAISTQPATTTAPAVDIPQKCLILLAASANSNDAVTKEGYYVFTNGMSNGYYKFHGMETYSDLPYTNKFGFVTLSCLCKRQGGLANCCQGNRAHLDVSGLNVKDPQSMEEDVMYYVMDICRTTQDSIGENVLPPTGELPGEITTTSTTSTASTSTSATTVAGTAATEGQDLVSNELTSTTATTAGPADGSGDGNGNGNGTTDGDGNDPDSIEKGIDDGEGQDDSGTTAKLSAGAIAGIAIGSAAFLSILVTGLVFLDRDRREKKAKRGQGGDEEMPPPTDEDDKLNALQQQVQVQQSGSGTMEDDQSFGIRSHDTTQDSVMTDDFSGEQREALRPLNSGQKPREWM